jgi:CARDB
VMRPLTGTMKMAMRFELLKRTRRWGHSVSVSGTDLKTWITPKDPTLGQRPGDRWVVKHPVVDLSAPAYYRFKVTFRWTGAKGRVIGRTVRQGPLCYQPELRADLVVTGIQVIPLAADPGFDRYVGTIRNAGRTASGPFRVEFSDGPNGQWSPQFKPVSQLLSHHQTMVSFKGPACSAAAPATITADPDHAVDDANPSNNSMETTCS